jgi:predicted RNase H-like HicB family nuclease
VSLTYTVVALREQDGRYSMIVPALDHLASFGNALPEALRMIEDAILLYVEQLRADGRPVPEDTATFTVEMGDAAEAHVYKVTVREAAAVA